MSDETNPLDKKEETEDFECANCGDSFTLTQEEIDEGANTDYCDDCREVMEEEENENEIDENAEDDEEESEFDDEEDADSDDDDTDPDDED
jgi:predicted RNA-binding Zn-ribbon protein involved in translation (DUF1610 family)